MTTVSAFENVTLLLKLCMPQAISHTLKFKQGSFTWQFS